MASLREHYDIERALADQLRRAGPQERQRLYTSLYDELFRKVPNHPQHQSAPDVRGRMKLVGAFLRSDSTYLEIGPGDCAFASQVAARVAKVYAVDVSAEITKASKLPANAQLIISDGSSVPVPAGTVTVAYSDQLMEHLHPDDARLQLQNIYEALAPGGTYICITPSRHCGPHDISQHFDNVATGFHLREYSYKELLSLFRQVGFEGFSAYAGGRGVYVRLPLGVFLFAERLLERHRGLARSFPGRALLGIRLVAHKPLGSTIQST